MFLCSNIFYYCVDRVAPFNINLWKGFNVWRSYNDLYLTNRKLIGMQKCKGCIKTIIYCCKYVSVTRLYIQRQEGLPFPFISLIKKVKQSYKTINIHVIPLSV